MSIAISENPLMSVLMPVYNCESYLAEAIESILSQTYRNFEFIIINDGSTDSSETIIRSYVDNRIRYLSNEKNLGLISTLNQGILLSKGKYILRMDADDVSFSERFEKQLLFMETNPDIDISGTWFLKSNRVKENTPPTTFAACKLNLINNSVLCHPSVIMRTQSIVKVALKFKKTALHAEDYQFWIDAVIAGLKISNLPETLLNYRVHPTQISSANDNIQRKTVNSVRLSYAKFIFGKLIEGNEEIYINLVDETVKDYMSYLVVKSFTIRLLGINLVEKKLNHKDLKLLFNKHLKNILSNILIEKKDEFYFLLKILFDKNFYIKKNLKIIFNHKI